MNEICSRIYYLIATGEVLTINPEMQRTVEPNTKEQDMETYPQLKDKNIDDVDFIELKYGTYITTFNNLKSCSVDVNNKQLIINYFTQEELDTKHQTILDEQALQVRISAIIDYANLSTTNVADLENAIIQSEYDSLIGTTV